MILYSSQEEQARAERCKEVHHNLFSSQMVRGRVGSRHIYIISAWASTLLVLQYRAMRRPRSVEWATGKFPRLNQNLSYKTMIINANILQN